MNLHHEEDNIVGVGGGFGKRRALTPAKNKKQVQTKSIECQVSPGLLAGHRDSDPNQQRQSVEHQR